MDGIKGVHEVQFLKDLYAPYKHDGLELGERKVKLTISIFLYCLYRFSHFRFHLIFKICFSAAIH